jgi:hypothetical protein
MGPESITIDNPKQNLYGGVKFERKKVLKIKSTKEIEDLQDIIIYLLDSKGEIISYFRDRVTNYLKEDPEF